MDAKHAQWCIDFMILDGWSLSRTHDFAKAAAEGLWGFTAEGRMVWWEYMGYDVTIKALQAENEQLRQVVRRVEQTAVLWNPTANEAQMKKWLFFVCGTSEDAITGFKL